MLITDVQEAIAGSQDGGVQPIPATNRVRVCKVEDEVRPTKVQSADQLCRKLFSNS